MVRVRALSLTLVAVFSTAATAATERVLNLDFGNGGQYVGDDGVLSSSGGTFWNEVGIQENPPSIRDFLLAPSELFDEFGQPFDIPTSFPSGGGLPLVDTGFGTLDGSAISSPSLGPLNDGIRLNGLESTFRVSEMSGPFDIVIYFNEPSSVALIDQVNGSELPSGSTSSTTGSFPGSAGLDFLRFDDVPPVTTTLGTILLPGVLVGLPDEFSTASIAAIQIRSVFGFMPEPSTATIAALGLLAVLVGRRRS